MKEEYYILDVSTKKYYCGFDGEKYLGWSDDIRYAKGYKTKKECILSLQNEMHKNGIYKIEQYIKIEHFENYY